MKKQYKNERDQYKAEAERLQWELAELKRKFEEKKKKEEEIKWYNVTVYCENCQHVSDYRIRQGLRLNEGGCIICNVKGYVHHVKHYPGKFNL